MLITTDSTVGYPSVKALRKSTGVRVGMNGHLLLHHLGRKARITAISHQLESMKYIWDWGRLFKVKNEAPA